MLALHLCKGQSKPEENVRHVAKNKASGFTCAHLQGVHEEEGERAADSEGEHAGHNEQHFANKAAPHSLIPEGSRPLGSLQRTSDL